jgi:hypothetical protein
VLDVAFRFDHDWEVVPDNAGKETLPTAERLLPSPSSAPDPGELSFLAVDPASFLPIPFVQIMGDFDPSTATGR